MIDLCFTCVGFSICRCRRWVADTEPGIHDVASELYQQQQQQQLNVTMNSRQDTIL